MRHPISRLVLAALFLGASVGAGLAAAAPDGSVLTVGLYESHRVPLGGEAAQVIVGDPTVADVVMVNAHSVIVMGKGYGSTQLIVTDRGGRTLLAGRVMVVGATSDAGHVTIYRGVDSTEYGCGPSHCQSLQGGSSPSGSSTVTNPPPPPGSAVGGGDSAAAPAAHSQL
jgi:hypothetical protein